MLLLWMEHRRLASAERRSVVQLCFVQNGLDLRVGHHELFGQLPDRKTVLFSLDSNTTIALYPAAVDKCGRWDRGCRSDKFLRPVRRWRPHRDRRGCRQRTGRGKLAAQNQGYNDKQKNALGKSHDQA